MRLVMSSSLSATIAFILLSFGLCSALPSTSCADEFILAPENLADDLQERLARAGPGDTIILPAGRFSMKSALLVMRSGVSLVGQGSDNTILDFASADAAQSILLRARDLTITGVSIVNPVSDGLVLRGIDGARITDVRVAWERGPDKNNGGYGIYILFKAKMC